MPHIYREHCCLILDRNTLKQSIDYFKGTFVPANFKTVFWLGAFNKFIEKVIANQGHLVEVGQSNNDSLSKRDALERICVTDEKKVGLNILSIRKLNEEAPSDGYEITFALAGPQKELVLEWLQSTEAFILATKSFSNDTYNGDAIQRKITEVVALQLLKQSELAIPIMQDVIHGCASTTLDHDATNVTGIHGLLYIPPNNISLEQTKPTPEKNNYEIVASTEPLFAGIKFTSTETLKESIMEAEQKASVVTVKTERHLSDQTICGNHDVGLVVKLNLAAGNSVDHIASPSVEEYERNIKRQLNIDASECGELWEAYVAGDTSLLRDALADKRITLNGFQPILPFPMILDYRLAVENNFTRFDSSHERALETQDKYKQLGVTTYITQVDLEDPINPTTYFVNKVLNECVGTDGNTYAKDKWVKSVYFTDDSFKKIAGLLSRDAQGITKRYTETRKMLKGLLKRIDQSFVDAIAKLED